jgi:hypothetical protein
MKIYLGGPSAERELVIIDAEKLEAAGHTITEPWWKRVHEAKSMGYASDADVSDEYMAESVRRNEYGLLAADVVVLRMRTKPDVSRHNRIGGPSGGLAYELGWIKGLERAREGAYGAVGDVSYTSRPIYVIGETCRFIGIWTEPKPIVVSSIDDVIRALGVGRPT